MATTLLQIAEPLTVRASDALTSSFAAGAIYTFTNLPALIAVECTYTRGAAGGYAEMRVEWSVDKSTWIYDTTNDAALTTSDPFGKMRVYVAEARLPTPADASALSFAIPLLPLGGYKNLRLSFREGSGLSVGTLGVTLRITQAQSL